MCYSFFYRKVRQVFRKAREVAAYMATDELSLPFFDSHLTFAILPVACLTAVRADRFYIIHHTFSSIVRPSDATKI